MSSESDPASEPSVTYHLMCVIYVDGPRNVLTTRTPAQWLADQRFDEQNEAVEPGPGQPMGLWPRYRLPNLFSRPVRSRITLVSAWPISEADALRLCDADPATANALRMEEHARRILGRVRR